MKILRRRESIVEKMLPCLKKKIIDKKLKLTPFSTEKHDKIQRKISNTHFKEIFEIFFMKSKLKRIFFNQKFTISKNMNFATTVSIFRTLLCINASLDGNSVREFWERVVYMKLKLFFVEF